MFIDIGGKLINASQILWIEPAPEIRGMLRSTIRFTTGDTLTVNVGTDWLATQRDEVIPAPAGYQALRSSAPEPSDPERAVTHSLLPVIAFRMRGGVGNLLEPITPEGPMDDFAIVGPDGRCWDYNGEYASLDAFKAEFEEQWARCDPGQTAA